MPQLSPAQLQALKPPPSGFVELSDAAELGLTLRVFASGRKTWTFRYRTRTGTQRRIRLGEYPSVGLAEARRRASRHRGKISDGADPQGAISAQRQASTLSELMDRYLNEEVQPKKKPRTFELYSYYLQKIIAPRLGGKKADEITPSMVDNLHRKLGEDRPVTANRVAVALSGVYAFATRRRLIATSVNPARGVEKFREQSRERYLSNDELGRLGQALRVGELEGLPWPDERALASKHERKPENRKSLLSPHVTAAFRLLLFTGCRLREILHLRWSEVDFDRGLLLLPESKTGRKTVVLNAPALEVLAGIDRIGEFVILGDDPKKPRADLKRPWELVRAYAELGAVRVHDLRHTHASIGAGLGLGLPIIGELLGHKHADTTAKYAHLDADPLRRASDRIGLDIANALDGLLVRGTVRRTDTDKSRTT